MINKTPYDVIATEYYDNAHKTSRNFDQTTIAALQNLRSRIPPDGLILDIGAGKGRSSEFLGVDSKRVIQLDISRAMLEIQPREDCLLRVVHNAEDLPFLDSQFSCITSFLCDPFLGLNFLSEVHRVLSDNGLFIATTPSFEWGDTLRPEIQLDKRSTRFVTKKGDRVIVPSVLVTNEHLAEMLVYVGFEDLHILAHRLSAGTTPVSNDISIPASKLGKSEYELDILCSIVAQK